MPDLKIVIPMAGVGKRLAPLTDHRPKALIRLGNKRLLDHVLDVFQELERTYALEYVFIVGCLGKQIQEHMRRVYPQKKVTYFLQQQPLGQSHAVSLAKEAIRGPMLLTYCDTINKIDFSFLGLSGLDGAASVQEVDDPRRHGVAVADPGGRLVRLVEKPKTMEYRSALTGLYYFAEGKHLLRAIEMQMQRGLRLNNEYYLADAINILLRGGARIKTHRVSQWLDAGTPQAVIETNAHLLRAYHRGDNQPVSDRSNLYYQPVYIHKSPHIENSVIGPNVSIGENCLIHGSVIKNSIIDDLSQVRDAILANFLAGKGCSINGHPGRSIVGDHEIVGPAS